MDLYRLKAHRVIWQTVNMTLLPIPKGVILSGRLCKAKTVTEDENFFGKDIGWLSTRGFFALCAQIPTRSLSIEDERGVKRGDLAWPFVFLRNHFGVRSNEAGGSSGEQGAHHAQKLYCAAINSTLRTSRNLLLPTSNHPSNAVPP